MLRRLCTCLAVAALLTLAAACAAPPPSPTGDTSDELAEFQQEILADLDKIEIFQQKTQRGVNLSEFNLGWFTMILLNELAAHDQELFDYLHVGDMNVEHYLRDSFQTNPQKEIAVMDAMARKTGSPIRLAARHALEMLTHIPGAADTPEIQAQSRKDLLASLSGLKTALTRVSADAIPHPPGN